MRNHRLNRPWRIVVGFLAVVSVSACGAGATSDVSSDGGVGLERASNSASAASSAATIVGASGATITIGDAAWQLPTVACIWNAGGMPLALAAAEGAIGLDLSKPQLVARILDQTEAGRLEGDGVAHEVMLRAGTFGSATLAWSSTTDVGGAAIHVDGSRVTAEGRFDDELTPNVESVEGSMEADCGTERPPLSAASETPAPDADGTVTVDGTAFAFTFGSPPQCGIPGSDGRVVGYAKLVDDPSRQVAITYGLAAETSNGQPALQIVIYAADGSQLWYSSVGITGADVGSIERLDRAGDTVTIAGTLAHGEDPSVTAPFEAVVTCSP
jgi:hypothetical protein